MEEQNNDQVVETVQAKVLTHNAKEIADSTFWMGHTISGSLVVIGVICILISKSKYLILKERS